jgi:hypothetical protein
MPAAMNFAVSAGLEPRGSTPSWSSRAANFCFLAARVSSAAFRLTMSSGVAAGAGTPFRLPTAKPGYPNSEVVGTCRAWQAHVALDTASIRMLPTCLRQRFGEPRARAAHF